MKVWGVSVSYFTGKIEAYLRYKGITYDMEPPFADGKRISKLAGAIQVPILECDDGRWMCDSTPMIFQLEKEHPDRPVMPSDPVVGFIAKLIEDYADEWLWRVAMHYRWSYDHDRELLSRILADEVTSHIPLPRIIRRHLVKSRQHKSFVTNDAVTPATQEHVEAGYIRALENMTLMLKDRPYLLGNAPSLADFGMLGPMMRHFAQDPTPASVMRNQAPAVYEWVSRMWNASELGVDPQFAKHVPDDAAPMLSEIAQTHLVQLRENAAAFHQQKRHFEMTVQCCHYTRVPVSQYRVYCLERLREAFEELSARDQTAVKALLAYPECDLLWTDTVRASSGYDEAREAPFNKGINVLARPQEPLITRLIGAQS